jgi:flagellar basal-body rod protein FlgC
MDYLQAFAISASGMAVEKLRVDLTAVNIANMHSTAGPDGALFRPLRVVSQPGGATFTARFAQAPLLQAVQVRGVQVLGVEELEVEPRMVHEPGNPAADDKGYVALPGVNHVSEMVTLLTALRAYEANVMAMNAARTMASKALEIGGGS